MIGGCKNSRGKKWEKTAGGRTAVFLSNRKAKENSTSTSSSWGAEKAYIPRVALFVFGKKNATGLKVRNFFNRLNERQKNPRALLGGKARGDERTFTSRGRDVKS